MQPTANKTDMRKHQLAGMVQDLHIMVNAYLSLIGATDALVLISQMDPIT